MQDKSISQLIKERLQLETLEINRLLKGIIHKNEGSDGPVYRWPICTLLNFKRKNGTNKDAESAPKGK